MWTTVCDLASFNSHIYHRYHRDTVGLSKQELPGELSPEPNVYQENENEGGITIELDQVGPLYGPLDGTLNCDEAPAVTRPVNSNKVESNFLQQNAKFILSLTEGKQVSQVAVKEVIEGFRDIWKLEEIGYTSETES